MRASISADPGRGPGNGSIEIFDVGDTGEPGCTLLRASDGKCLGPRGWQESETLLTPDAWDNDGGSLRMAVGPAVVDEVDNLDAYRLSLRGAGSCSLAVKSLVYSHIANKHGMGAGAPLTAPVAAPIPAPVEPEPEPEPAPQWPTAAELEAIHQEAYQAGYDAGHAEGLARGADAGHQQAFAHASQQFAQELQAFADLQASFQANLTELEAEMAPALLNLAVNAMRKLLHDHLACKPDAVLSVVRQALHSIPGEVARATVRAHPNDLQVLKTFLPANTPDTQWQFVEDASLMSGGCLIELPSASLDLTLQTRWKALMATLGADGDVSA